MMQMPVAERVTRVVKIGGSLLTLPDLGRRLTNWLNARFLKSDRTLLIAGGGAAADLVRQWDEVHQLGESASHRLAISAMAFTAAVLQVVLAQAADSEADGAAPAVRVFSPDELLCCLQRDRPASAEPAELRPALQLPRRWSVTSDSIAAALAEGHRAQELILLKSTGPTEQTVSATESGRLHEWVANGWVDEHFPAAAQAAAVPIRFVNFRAGAAAER